jgi:thiol:disulfide interchange protein
MTNRLLISASIFVILGVACYFASTTFSQSGRNRDARTQRDETPSLTTEDLPPSRGAAPAGSGAPAPSDVARAAGAISWQTSFADATRTATRDQVIFVDVYTDWCGWCKYMDSRVYSDAAVRDFAAKQVFVKVDAEDGGEGEAFARRAGVQGYPTLLVYSHDGHLIGKQVGAFRAPNDFLTWLRATSEHR